MSAPSYPNAIWRNRQPANYEMRFTNLGASDLPDAEHWMNHYLGGVNRNMISDLLQESNEGRHFDLVGVRFTPAGDFVILQPHDTNYEVEVAISLVVEPNFFTRPKK